MQHLSFKKNFSWALLGQLATVSTQFLIITTIARIGTVADVGLYGLTSALVSPIQLFFLMDIGKLIIVEKDFEINLKHYHSAFIINCLLMPIISGAIILIIYHDIATLLSAFSIAVYWSLTNYREYYYSIYQRLQRLDFQGKSSIVYAVVSIAVFTITFYVTKVIYIAFFVLSIAYSAVLLLYENRKVKKLCSTKMTIQFSWPKQKAIFSKGISLGSTAFFTSFKANVPRYIIEYILKNRELLGFYTICAQCVLVIGTINLTAAKSIMGKFSAVFYSERKKFNALLINACLASFISGVVVWLLCLAFGKTALNILFGEQYIHASFILSWLMFSRIFVMPSTYLRITQVLLSQIHSQLAIMFSSIAVIGLCYFCFFSSFKIDGLLYAVVISDFFVLILTAMMVYLGIKKLGAFAVI